MGASGSLEGMGISDDTLRKRYDSFAKQNTKGFVSFDKYKKTAEQLSPGNFEIQNVKYMLPSQYKKDKKTRRDEYGNEIKEKAYTDEEYEKMKIERNNRFLNDLDVAANEEAARGLNGTAGQRKAMGAGNNGEGDGYSERLRGNIRKAIGRNKV